MYSFDSQYMYGDQYTPDMSLMPGNVPYIGGNKFEDQARLDQYNIPASLKPLYHYPFTLPNNSGLTYKYQVNPRVGIRTCDVDQRSQNLSANFCVAGPPTPEGTRCPVDPGYPVYERYYVERQEAAPAAQTTTTAPAPQTTPASDTSAEKKMTLDANMLLIVIVFAALVFLGLYLWKNINDIKAHLKMLKTLLHMAKSPQTTTATIAP